MTRTHAARTHARTHRELVFSDQYTDIIRLTKNADQKEADKKDENNSNGGVWFKMLHTFYV